MGCNNCKSLGMLPRQISKEDLTQARRTLSRKGITQRQAAEMLGVTLWHLNRVLKGHRESRRILQGIETLPNKEAAR